ncbi:FAD-dependent oxidoreductase [Saccharospirillum sp. MSK14-1]|uniref:D-amino acid dehydrogenase n=1 Tax=Saccharospirillum sp. MSK14-1 TaxID=1897632 RepID=UPI000D34FDA4|nr:D-amino acid dehydrogenase [Saccharospirillum sp. MSK14-1]PTY36177.1 FAD-dependent oxidoreductase [Saccharospirillum sp. MSK14-1]
MKILIIGAGVIGVTTAWTLHRRGHEVTVVDKASAAALETSYANAGQRSYGHVSPWASPSMIRQALPSMLRSEGPLKLKLPPSGRMIQFLVGMSRFAGQPALYRRNHDAMLRLAQFSREQFLALEDAEPFDFDGGHRGLLKLADTDDDKRELLDIGDHLTRLGIENRWLDADETRAQEPGLSPDIAGGLLVPGDGTGDCQSFTERLAERAAAAGVQFRYRTEATHLRTDDKTLHSVQLNGPDGEQWFNADAFVLCAGCGSRELAFSLGVHLPIYPVKGYSLTAPVAVTARAPQSTLIDENRKVAITRLGDRVRVTGFAELADFDRRLLPRRLNSIRDSLEKRFPGAAQWDKAEPWAGFRPMTPDGPAAIGLGRQSNVYYNTGHGTWGWTLAMGSAEIIAQQVAGEEPAVEMTAFRPRRFTGGLA